MWIIDRLSASMSVPFNLVIFSLAFNIIQCDELLNQIFQRAGKQQYTREPNVKKPNIILILTDDQDVELGSMNVMPHTLRLLRDEGAEFSHSYVATPLCCPSRSSLLTGLYTHNHRVLNNGENCYGSQWQEIFEPFSFAAYLSDAGYRTGYFGKYLNRYNGKHIPPGWQEWRALLKNSKYYNYSINVNGEKIEHNDNYYEDYYPDLLANDSVSFLRESKRNFSDQPFMMVVSFPSPHGPEDSAPQYSKMFFNVTTHHTPSYNYAPNPDKQWILRFVGRMQLKHQEFTNLLMTKRLQTLQSVDAAVKKIYKELDFSGELENTYIVYTSDNGYHVGQFGLVKGKQHPLETDIRVPFLIRGPKIKAGLKVDEAVLNIDLAPTFLDIAGIEIPPHMDGRSIMKLLNRRKKYHWPDTILIESRESRTKPHVEEASTRVENDVNKSSAGNGQCKNRSAKELVSTKRFSKRAQFEETELSMNGDLLLNNSTNDGSHPESNCTRLKGLNLFIQNNDHWKTPPYWRGGQICSYVNAQNNTYSCLRTYNSTHNFLYCEFITGTITFYNFTIDPFQLTNMFSSLNTDERIYLHRSLKQLRTCKGTIQCTLDSSKELHQHPNDHIGLIRESRRPMVTIL